MESKEILCKLIKIHDDDRLGLNVTPYGTDKLLYKSYIERLYPELLASLVNVNSIIEIGVRGGASLYLWSQLFPEASVIGMDLEEIGSSAGPTPKYVSGRNTTFIKGNAYTLEVANKTQNGIDLIIDDGSHFIEDQLKFVEIYLSKLSAHGVLVIEDIQRGYRDVYKVLKRLPYHQYRLIVHDNRFNKFGYDDFAISITSGKTSLANRLYFKIRSYTFVLEHLLVKLLAHFKTRSKNS